MSALQHGVDGQEGLGERCGSRGLGGGGRGRLRDRGGGHLYIACIGTDFEDLVLGEKCAVTASSCSTLYTGAGKGGLRHVEESAYPACMREGLDFPSPRLWFGVW